MSLLDTISRSDSDEDEEEKKEKKNKKKKVVLQKDKGIRDANNNLLLDVDQGYARKFNPHVRAGHPSSPPPLFLGYVPLFFGRRISLLHFEGTGQLL